MITTTTLHAMRIATITTEGITTIARTVVTTTMSIITDITTAR